MNINEYVINNRYKTTCFVNNPTFDSYVNIVLDKIINEYSEVFFSIVIPIHNQESIIINNIESILINTAMHNYEIIIILDSCDDNTENLLIDYFKDIKNERFILFNKILILRSEIPLFETTSDNLGCFCSKGKYILEIQADMEMTQYGYNIQLLKPFLKRNDILGISGRCCHNFICNKGIGKLGLDILKPIGEIPNLDINSFYIGETCNRGPLLLDNNKLKELGYFDECNYFLDDSDHDLFARGFLQKKWVCGYVPIDFNSPLINGSTRKKRNEINEKYYNLKKQTTKN